jgi:hypothetical protein
MLEKAWKKKRFPLLFHRKTNINRRYLVCDKQLTQQRFSCFGLSRWKLLPEQSEKKVLSKLKFFCVTYWKSKLSEQIRNFCRQKLNSFVKYLLSQQGKFFDEIFIWRIFYSLKISLPKDYFTADNFTLFYLWLQYVKNFVKRNRNFDKILISGLFGCYQ